MKREAYHLRDAVLIVIDLQNDFCSGGGLPVPGGEETVEHANAISRRFSNVILTQDWHPSDHASFANSHTGKAPFDVVAMPYGEQTLWPAHCIQGSSGAALHPDLDVPHAQLIIRKGCNPTIDSYSAFFENDHVTPTGLAGYLRERNLHRLYLCGLALDFCVAWSAVDARAHGFETTVVEDACRAIDAGGSLSRARASMSAAGVRLVRINEVLN